jgi:hypothetical protein
MNSEKKELNDFILEKRGIVEMIYHFFPFFFHFFLYSFKRLRNIYESGLEKFVQFQEVN